MAALADIAVAGHICIDITPRFPESDARTLNELFVPGASLRVAECIVSTGGPVSNTGLALHRLGMSVVLMGKAGDDVFGRMLVDKMREAGCASGIRIVPGEVTSYTIVVAVPGIDRVFLHSPGANDTYAATDVDYRALDNVKLFHLGYPPLMRSLYADNGSVLIDIMTRAKATGVTTSLDMAQPDPESPAGRADWQHILREVLPHVDLFLPSIEEMLMFLDRPAFLAKRAEARQRHCPVLELIAPEDYTRLSDMLLAYGAGIVALKSGPRGIYVRTGSAERLRRFGRAPVGDTAAWANREIWSPAFHVERVASATGSGDSAIAGFLAAFVHGENIEHTLMTAIMTGTQNVMVYDAVSGIKSYTETVATRTTWPRDPLSISAPGWRYDHAAQLWHGPRDGV